MFVQLIQDSSSGWLSVNQNILGATILSSICFSAILVHYYYKNAHSYWKNKGLDGPTPWPLVGNLLQIFRGDRMKQSLEWPVKHGKVFGIYFGAKPQVFINDPEVVLQISVKDFDIFPNHEINEFANKYQKAFLFFAQDAHWKKMRVFMSPTFTSGKIKRMFKLLDRCADDLVLCYSERLIDDKLSPTGQSLVIDPKEVYNLYTMDAIATCCYGLKLERAGTGSVKGAASRNEFVRRAMKVFEFSLVRFMISAIVPARLLRWFDFQISPVSMYQSHVDMVSELIKSRKSVNNKKFNDYLQLLIDAELDHELELNDMDLSENHHAGLTHDQLIEDQKRMVAEVKNQSSKMKLELTDIEILSSAMILMVVGVETTSTLLTNSSYLLAFHQDIQERLYKELKSFAKFNDNEKVYSFGYEDITSSQYLDAFVSESLRFYPPILVTDRVSNADYRIEKYNLDLPKGTKINLNLYHLMNSPDYWSEPKKFNPDRFMPGNKDNIIPGAYCPFGIGPRHCIGMRFSLTESKLALAKILINYKIVPAPNTQFPTVFKTSIGFGSIKDPRVKLIPR